jgi:hypothetical protein
MDSQSRSNLANPATAIIITKNLDSAVGNSGSFLYVGDVLCLIDRYGRMAFQDKKFLYNEAAEIAGTSGNQYQIYPAPYKGEPTFTGRFHYSN